MGKEKGGERERERQKVAFCLHFFLSLSRTISGSWSQRGLGVCVHRGWNEPVSAFSLYGSQALNEGLI